MDLRLVAGIDDVFNAARPRMDPWQSTQSTSTAARPH
jgi:hypothetical protein